MAGITALSLFIGAVVVAAALARRYLWRVMRGKSSKLATNVRFRRIPVLQRFVGNVR
jgi:hypothetical protein